MPTLLGLGLWSDIVDLTNSATHAPRPYISNVLYTMVVEVIREPPSWVSVWNS